MNHRQCNEGYPLELPGDNVNCDPKGLYMRRGDPNPPPLFMNGTAHGCLQIRQPYWVDAMKFYAKMIYRAGTAQASDNNQGEHYHWLNGPPSCPQRFDFPDPEEKTGRPEGYAFLESYEMTCSKMAMGAYKQLSPGANRASRALAIPPGSWNMPFNNPLSYKEPGIRMTNWMQRHPSCDFVPGPETATWVNPRTGEDGEQYPNVPPGEYNSKKHWVYKAGMGEWSKDCACEYSKFIVGLYMMQYEAEGKLSGKYYWSDPRAFSPSQCTRAHHLGGGRANAGQPEGGWDSLPHVHNDDWHQWETALQWEEEICGDADIESEAWKECARYAVGDFFHGSRAEDLPRTFGSKPHYRPSHRF